MAWTNIHKQRMFEAWFEGSGTPNNFYLMLTNDSVTAATSSLTQVTPVASSNSWGGSAALAAGTGISLATYNTTINNQGYSQATISPITITVAATGTVVGPFQNVILVGDPNNGTNFEVYAYWGLGASITITQNQTFTLSNGSFKVENT
jgi:hypothetical protein